MKNIKRILGVILFALTIALVAPSVMPVNGNIHIVEAATKINKKKVTLIKGQTTTLKITGTKKKVKWSSNKKSVATVSSKGKVTAKKKGTAKITAKLGNKKYTCEVTVQVPKINNSKLTVSVGETSNLFISGTDQKVTWKSSNKKIATVDKNGIVKGIKAGNVKITATVLKKKYVCSITVQNKKENPQNEYLDKIDKKFILGSFYSSEWKNALICIFKNNTGHDLEFRVEVDCYLKNGEFWDTQGETHPYFKNGSEIVMVFDDYDLGGYKIDYKIKKTPESSKYVYENSGLYEERDQFNRVIVNSNTNLGFYGDGVIVYFDENGKVIDYNVITVDVDNEWNNRVKFDLPVDRNLDSVKYNSYLTSYYSYEY